MKEELNTKIKRLVYQSFYRGCKETDIILGKFAKRYLHTFNNEEVELFEELLKIDDRDIFNWVSRKEPVPQDMNNKIISLLVNFNVAE